MKVSIVTIYNVSNYGTALQAYATQTLVERLGCSAEIVNYISPQRTLRRCLFWVPEQYRNKPIQAIMYIILRLPNNIHKRVVFNRFHHRWLHLSKRKYITVDDLRKNPPDADVYLTGSDQVWNSDYNEGIDHGFFLDFGDRTVKRYAFAASLGMDRIPNDEIDEIRKLLSQYDAITVRELQAVEELRNIGISASIVLDPTLLIKKEEWLTLANKKIKYKDYVLVMVLYGEDGVIPEIATYIGKEMGKEIIELVWNPLKTRPWTTVYGRSPEEFISYVNQASYIITNSFHVTAFSINLEKQFLSVKREQYNTRISSLLDALGIPERYVGKNDDWSIYEKPVQYSEINERITKLRHESLIKLKAMIGE